MVVVLVVTTLRSPKGERQQSIHDLDIDIELVLVT